MAILKAFSPAKINLFLEVPSKRIDGYHELITLFAKMNFGDDIEITLLPQNSTEIDIITLGPLAANLPPKEQNLVYRAADGFFKLFNISAYCSIKLFKTIPMGAGLGGGSSNAGTVLRLLARHYGKSTAQILPLAAKLGADVALFIYDDTFLIGTGIGEVLTPVKAAPNTALVVVAYPQEHISTKDVFSKLQLPGAKDLLTKSAMLDKISLSLERGAQLGTWGDNLFNRLEEGVLSFSQKVRALKGEFREFGAEYVLMSGSGSSVFGLFDDQNAASSCAKRLQAKGYTVFNTTFGGTEHEDK